jgi:hypothetical protein
VVNSEQFNVRNGKIIIEEITFPPIQNIQSQLSDNVWETSIDSTTLPDRSINSISDLVSYLNTNTSGYTWTKLDGDAISVSHSTAFSVVSNNFSRLLLTCDDFMTVSTSHTFTGIILYPYISYYVESNPLLPSREFHSTRMVYLSVPIKGEQYWNGCVKTFDTQSIANYIEDNPSFQFLKRCTMNFGVILSDGTQKRISNSIRNPWSIKLYLSSED